MGQKIDKSLPGRVRSRVQAFRDLSSRVQLVVMVLLMAISSVPATLLMPRVANAATAGPNSPSSASGTTWVTPTNVYASDGAYASYSLASSATSSALNITGFGFNIPSTATINGVQVDVQKYTDNTSSNATIEDSNVQLLKANTAGGTSLATTTPWPTTNSYVTYGSSSNLWGNTLAASDINNSGFGVALSATNIRSRGGATANVFVDYVRITITYTLPAASLTQASYRWYNNADSVQPGTAMAAESTPTSLASPGSKARLRMSLSNVGNNPLAQNSKSFKLQYATSTTGTWMDVSSSSGSWTTRRKITFNNSASTENLINFPVRVSLNSSNINYSKTQSAGQDIRFTDSDGSTLLSYEIEAWNQGGDSEVWVKVPQIDAGSTTDFIYMYYGNPSATDGQSPHDVWDANYQAVYHSQQTTGTSLTDSTAHAQDGVKQSATLPNPVSGKIDYGQQYSASANVSSSGFVTINGVSNAIASGSVTYSLWMNLTNGFSSTESVDQMLIALDDANSWNDVKLRLSRTTGALNLETYNSSNTLVTVSSTQTTWPGGTWYFISGTFDVGGAGMKLYVNGSLVGSNTNNTRGVTPSTQMLIGRDAGGINTNGTLDEVRVSNVARSASWVNAEYLTGNDAMNTFGAEETSSLPLWQYYNNPTPADGAPITSALLSGTPVTESYAESNPTVTNPTAIAAGQKGEWDFSLDTSNAVAGTTYYFRMVDASGAPLDTYSVYPQLSINSPPTLYNQASYRFFDNQDVGSSYTLKTTSSYTVGSDSTYSVTYIASGDFNGDSKPDIVHLNATTSSADSISVYLNDGSGGFTNRTDFPGVNTTGNGIAVADLNGDSKPDVVVSDKDANFKLNLTVFMNTTASGATTPTFTRSLVVVASSSSLTDVADITGDGKPDVIAQNSTGFDIYPNTTANGATTPTFGTVVSYNTTKSSYCKAGYLDANSSVDLACATSPGGGVNGLLTIYLNSGTGTLSAFGSPYTLSFTNTSLVIGDFNNDTHPDIGVIEVSASVAIAVFLNNGSASFTGSTTYPITGSGQNILSGDFDGDNKVDILLTDGGTSIITLPGNGDGTFGTSISKNIGGSRNFAVTAADYNNDGHLDVAVTNQVQFGTDTMITVLSGSAGASSIDVGSPLAAANTAAAVAPETPFRLRSRIAVDTTALAQNGQDFKLQYVQKSGPSCDPNAAGYSDAYTVSTANPSGYAGSATEVGGTTQWTNTSNATGGPDSQNASDVISSYGLPTSQLDLTNFGLLIPTGATINGVTATVSGSNSANNASIAVYAEKSDATVSLTPSGTETWPTSASPTTTVGSSTNLVGQGWTSADFNGSGFTITLKGTNFAFSSNTLNVDSVQVTVYYTGGTTTPGPLTYYDNPVATDGMAFAANSNDPTNSGRPVVLQSYHELDPFTDDAASIPSGSDGMWDFALTSSAAADGNTYCLRIIKSDGSLLDTYTQMPEITIGTAPTNSAPGAPATLAQKKTDDTVLATGAWVSGTSIKFTASATDPDASDTLQLCVEKKPLGTAFGNTDDSCGAGVAYSGTAITVTVTISGITDATAYHWQARVKDAAGGYSAWVAYGGNAESAQDFGIDTTAPTGGTVYDGTTAGTDTSFNDGSLSALSANWSSVNVNVSGLAGYEYSIGTSAGATDIKGWTSTGTTASATVSGLALHTSNKYFFNVRTTDNAGNVSSVISSDGQFVAPSVSFSVAPSVITFSKLNNGNNYTDTKTTTLTTSTNAYGGYIIRSLMPDLLRSRSNKTIADFTGGTYAAPDSWQPGDTGFGYTSSDTSVQGANKFQSATCLGGSALAAPGCYAPFSHSTPGDVVADNTNSVSGTPISNEQFTITYRVTTTSTQPATTYDASTIYSITPVY